MFRYIFGILFAAIPLFTAAQVPDTTFSITSDPQYPKPNEEVTLTLNTHGTDISGGIILWYIDGQKQNIYTDQKNIALDAGTFGTETHVAAVLESSRGNKTTEYTVSPRVVDIIIESNSSVPPWYRGAALPSEGSTFSAGTIYHTTNNNGPYTYIWELGSSRPIIKTGQYVTFHTPKYDTTLFLTIKDSAGNRIARGNTEITKYTPFITLYRGGSYHAIPENYYPQSDTETYRAEIFHLAANTTDTRWEINGTPVDAASGRTLTLQNLRTSVGSVVEYFTSYGSMLTRTMQVGFRIISE